MSEGTVEKALGANIYNEAELDEKLSKADTVQKVGFTAQVGTIPTVFKADGDFIIWGPASVEVVDKEGDLIEASALSDALPQLLKRARLSLEHSDQIVGQILERFETEEPAEVEVDGHRFERSEFPTDVLELDGIEPALYVAGKVWDDTRQARETRRDIMDGKIDSYSISGEALMTRTKVDDGETYDEIVDMDLSAVTLCEEGMNQKAKFGVVTGDEQAGASDGEVVEAGAESTSGPSAEINASVDVDRVGSVATKALSKTMSDNDGEDGDTAKSGGGFNMDELESKFEEVIEANLPDGELATKDDVEDTVHDLIEQTDRASTQDDTDDPADSPHDDYEGYENPTERDFTPATIERIADNVVATIEEKYDLDGGDDSEKSGEEQLAEALERIDGLDADTILEAAGYEDKPDDYEGGDHDEEEEDGGDEDAEVPEELQENALADDRVQAALKEALPEDVFEVVREYTPDDGDTVERSEGGSDGVEKSSEGITQGDLEDAVESVLKGADGVLSKSDGVEGAGAATGGEDPEPSFEKGEDPTDTGSSHPALANIYDREGGGA